MFFRKEFSLIPTGDDNLKNKSPVLYEESCLGLESWCVKHVYKYAHTELIEVRTPLTNKKLPLYKMKDLNHLLIGVLLINPDVYTFWNMKRELIERSVLNINKELSFTRLVLSHKSKSNEAFAYRRWLLTKLLNQTSAVDARFMDNVINKELEVTNIAAEKAQNNYHAWNHRIWIFNIIKSNLQFTQNHIANELQFSLKWILSHVSEHSGFHYRQFLINCVKEYTNWQDSFDMYYSYVKKYFKTTKNVNYTMLLREILGPWDLIVQKKQSSDDVNKYMNCVNYISVLLYDLFYTLEVLYKSFPGHESIWYYRRSITHFLFKTVCDILSVNLKSSMYSEEILRLNQCDSNLNENAALKYADLENGEKEPKLFKLETNKLESSNLYKLLLQNEQTFARDSTISDNYLTVTYAKQYEKWLQFVVQLYKI